jgi:Ankyrin repeats (many copies)
MKRIEGQLQPQVRLAKRVLSWIICAKRPLTTLELQHALAVKVGQAEFDKDNMSDIKYIDSVCRLVQEYFKKTQKTWFPTAEFDITAICVTYLSFTLFGSGYCPMDSCLEERLLLNPLYNYAACYWGHRARQASSLHPKIFEFLQCTSKIEAAAQALLARKRHSWHSGYSQEVPNNRAAYFGITESVAVILQSADVDSKDTDGWTPLWYAAKNGHEAVVKLLLDTGKVDVDPKS